MRPHQYFFISVYAFALSYLWNGVGPIILPQLVQPLVPAAVEGTAIGSIRFIGLLAALVLQPIIGTLSDIARTPFGRRRPFVAVGTLGDVIFLAGLFLAPNFPLLLIAYLGLQLASNIAQGAYQGYVPDVVPPHRLGLAAGLKNAAEMSGLLVASFVITWLFGAGERGLAALTIGLVLVVSAALTWFGAPERPTKEEPAQPTGWLPLRVLFHFEPADRPFAIWLASRFFILLGVYVLQNFAFLYVQRVLQPEDPNALVRVILTVIGLFIALSVLPAGPLADRVGYRPMVALAGLLNAVGIFLLLFATGQVVFQVAGLEILDVILFVIPVGIGTGIFLVTNWALGIALAPPDSGGRYLGLSNLATAGAGMMSGLGGPILDLFGFPPLFALSSGVVLVGVVLLRWLPERRP